MRSPDKKEMQFRVHLPPSAPPRCASSLRHATTADKIPPLDRDELGNILIVPCRARGMPVGPTISNGV